MLNCMALWQSVEVYRATLGRDPQSRQMHPSHRAFTQYIVQYGFTSGSRTTSNVGYLNTATEPMIVLRGPIRVDLCLRFAIWLNVCDGRRPWLPNFDRSAISGVGLCQLHRCSHSESLGVAVRVRVNPGFTVIALTAYEDAAFLLRLLWS